MATTARDIFLAGIGRSGKNVDLVTLATEKLNLLTRALRGLVTAGARVNLTLKDASPATRST